jgi:hypothetical protein
LKYQSQHSQVFLAPIFTQRLQIKYWVLSMRRSTRLLKEVKPEIKKEREEQIGEYEMRSKRKRIQVKMEWQEEQTEVKPEKIEKEENEQEEKTQTRTKKKLKVTDQEPSLSLPLLVSFLFSHSLILSHSLISLISLILSHSPPSFRAHHTPNTPNQLQMKAN